MLKSALWLCSQICSPNREREVLTFSKEIAIMIVKCLLDH